MSESNPNDNPILHASVLRGTLTIKVTETDVRRTTETSLVSALVSQSEIETDYILEVSSTDKAKEELETYSCSKRYVDMRHLANTMRDHAEQMAKYYDGKSGNMKEGGKPKRRTIFGSSPTSQGKISKGFERGFQYVTNSEPSRSNLTADFDKNKQKKLMKERSSNNLDEGAPLFVRDIMVGVDEFYDEIYSEKRQFGNKTNFDHVKSVAERRKTKINSAFSQMVNALSSADLSSVSKVERDSMPVPLQMLLKSLEQFLLTDVVLNQGNANIVTEKSATRALKVPDIGASVVNPMTTRRRASVVDRVAEEKKCQEVEELVIEEKEVDDVFIPSASAEKEIEETIASSIAIPKGVLPDHPNDFAIIVAVGALIFKALEGREVSVSMDMLTAFGIVCALIGYQMAVLSAVHVESIAKKDVSPAKHAAPTLPQSSTPSEEKNKSVPDRRLSRRSLFQKSSGTLKLSRADQQRKSLIQASMHNIQIDMVTEEVDTKEEKPVIPAKTFEKFTDGAALGSQLSCWSSPASKNFHVRGPNYLKDKKKVPSADYLFPCRGCDLFLTDNPPENLGRNRSILNGKLRDVPTFIINYRLPWGVFLSYHEIPERFIPFLRRGNGHGDLSAPLPSMADMTAGERAMCNFLLSDTEEKNEVLKIVPMVVEGPWVVKRVVGGKPAIIGTKMPINYVYQPPEKGLAEYLEADLDIVSSAAARNILAVVRSYTQSLTIDLGYVVQGNNHDELPEQMMLGLRIHGLDPLAAELLPEFDDGMVVPELDEDTGYDTE